MKQKKKGVLKKEQAGSARQASEFKQINKIKRERSL